MSETPAITSYPFSLAGILLKDFSQPTGFAKEDKLQTQQILFRDKFFISSTEQLNFEKGKVKNFYNWYGKNIIQKYRKTKHLDERFDKAPTFKEFVEFLVDLPLRKFNPHWLPIYIQCMPCSIKYTILARVDTISKDSKLVLERLGVSARFSVSHATNNSLDPTISTYYSQLSRKLLDKLYNIYKFDFLLFNYSHSEYYEYITE